MTTGFKLCLVVSRGWAVMLVVLSAGAALDVLVPNPIDGCKIGACVNSPLEFPFDAFEFVSWNIAGNQAVVAVQIPRPRDAIGPLIVGEFWRARFGQPEDGNVHPVSNMAVANERVDFRKHITNETNHDEERDCGKAEAP